MRIINISAYQIGLVLKNGAYHRFLTEGKHLLWPGERVSLYDMSVPFAPPVALNILLQDSALSALLELVTVKDHWIALQYEDGLLADVLQAGRHAFWKGVINYSFIYADTSQLVVDSGIDSAQLDHVLLAPYVRTVSIANGEKAVLFIDDKYDRILDSGVYHWWKNNKLIHVVRVDMRKQQLEINGQEILTKDKAALRVNAWAQYQVVDIEKAVLQNQAYDRQLYISLQLAMREYIATYSFDALLESKADIAAAILPQVKQQAEALGIALHGFGIRDIILPGDVKDIVNQVLLAEKNAQAEAIRRREETANTRSLLNTARLLKENEMLWKLKEMEHIEKIADRVNSISLNGDGQLLEQFRKLFTP